VKQLVVLILKKILTLPYGGAIMGHVGKTKYKNASLPKQTGAKLRHDPIVRRNHGLIAHPIGVGAADWVPIEPFPPGKTGSFLCSKTEEDVDAHCILNMMC
jgi:hypothetical protein